MGGILRGILDLAHVTDFTSASKNSTDVERLKKKLYGSFKLTHLHIHAGCWALNAIDMALWDILGKVCGQPLYKVWGGAFRKEIEIYGPIGADKPEEVAVQARKLVREGFRTIYTKVGFSAEEDLARVRAASDVPIAAHESSWTMYDALNVIKRGAADIIHVDPRLDAGFGGARITAGMAEAAGIPVVMHTYQDLGVSQCAKLHLIALGANYTLANQGGGYYPLADDVIKGGLMPFKDGCLRVPEAPGIGVDLDQEKVAEFRRHYEEHLKGQEFADKSASQYGMMQYRRYLDSVQD